MLHFGRFTVPTTVDQLMMIDSLEMTDGEREMIAQYCADALEQRIVITHGTGTMVETARVIANKKLDKTIVLTGAMVPYTMYGSDCLFNIGTALALVQTLPSGVYIGMNGECFDPFATKKNQNASRFEHIVQ